MLHTYDWAFQRPGGGEVQLLQTERHLRELGVRVDRFDRWTTRLEEHPLVHSFSLIPHDFWHPVKLAGCGLLVSTIHWPTPKEQGLRDRVRGVVVGAGRRILGGGSPPEGKPFRHVDLFLPNSQMEADLLCQVYKLPPEKMHVVPNGVEERFLGATPDAFVARYGLRDFVLCVGRIDGRKNQLTLVRALKGIGRPIVCIGEPVLGQEEYLEECRREGGADVHFLGKLEHDSPLLASAYAAAAVLALPTWIETPGLCALEAALAGTPIVITELGCTREYFGEHVRYIRPDDPEGIRVAVEAVLREPPDAADLRERVHQRYLWRHAAAATLAAYERVLAGRTRGAID